MATVLVVDDSAVDRQLVQGILRHEDSFTVVTANDGQAALDVIPDCLPDVVITDLQMPQLDGLQLVRTIKDEYPWIPVILITSVGSEEIAATALASGAASYVPKQHIARDLADTVMRVLLASSDDMVQPRVMHHLVRDNCEFEFPNDLSTLQSVSHHLKQALRCLPLGDEVERIRAGIALDEALMNAYLHGNLEVRTEVAGVDREAFLEVAERRRFEPEFNERKLHVSMDLSRKAARFVIRDDGHGFDVASFENAADQFDMQQPTGRGIVLMRSMMDEVQYNDVGNEVTLVKHAVSEDASDEDDDA
ncbi:MAG: response regulator [Planctomycetota bacterium]|nr:response regulator [Planctomycetota bacterium]